MRGLYRFVVEALINPIASLLGRKILNLYAIPRQLMTHDYALRSISGQYLRSKYPELAVGVERGVELNRHEYKVSSHYGQDGILAYIFSIVGVTNRTFVEFGVEDGTECNAANLAINFGFNGLLMDGSERNVVKMGHFYRSMLGERSTAVKAVQSWITAENINDVIAKNGIEGEIDLLSVDIDGNDYWVWKAITRITPRVVAIEYNAVFGLERSVTIPYAPSFNKWKADPSGFYHGASLPALYKLAAAKGYSLVGCDSGGMDAFFVRDDVLKGTGMSPVDPKDAFFAYFRRLQEGIGLHAQYEQVKHLPLIAV